MIKRKKWTGAEKKLLGQMPDREVAKSLLRSVISVKMQRVRLGILAFPDPESKARPYTAAELALLGKIGRAHV